MITRTFRKKDLAIDLGTANTLIGVKGQGVVVNEPSVLAVRAADKGGQTVFALGLEAKSMLGREPQNIRLVRPIRDGVIADFTSTAQMLQALVDKAWPKGVFRPAPRIAISVPATSTQVERRAIREAALSTGATEVYLVEAPMAAALGAGLPVAEAEGSMVIHFGAGTTELAVLSLGGVVRKAGLRLGGDHLEEHITHHVRRQHGILIGERTAERIKIEVGNVLFSEPITHLEVSGQKFSEGVPRSVMLSSTEVREALTDPLSSLMSLVRQALQQMPAELAADLAVNGIVLTGGGALLKNMDTWISEETGLPVRIADDPLFCVVKGCGMALENKAALTHWAAPEE